MFILNFLFFFFYCCFLLLIYIFFIGPVTENNAYGSVWWNVRVSAACNCIKANLINYLFQYSSSCCTQCFIELNLSLHCAAKSKTLSGRCSDSLSGNQSIRRTASLDTIYLKGQWPREPYYMHSSLLVDKSTQVNI